MRRIGTTHGGSRLCGVLVGAALCVFSLLPLAALAQAPPAAADAPAAASARDTLLPGDLVRLRVWREPDLSGDFAVDETGTVVLPRLGPTRVRGVPAGELRERIVYLWGDAGSGRSHLLRAAAHENPRIVVADDVEALDG
ncbi:MAG TPA: polysaccharide biosynthesis/export family protein, partial [Longimicrobium sp.]|nr:polysaccharide biosynthesis/export family protein [Longimicrobium sp.]